MDANVDAMVMVIFIMVGKVVVMVVVGNIGLISYRCDSFIRKATRQARCHTSGTFCPHRLVADVVCTDQLSTDTT